MIFFLLYDSYSDDNYNLNGRIIIYATEKNLRKLFQCHIWFADGTFKCAPSIFYQLFTIMGSFNYMRNVKQETAVRPFVFACLENKEERTYKKVLDIVIFEAQQLNIRIQLPRFIISDFELAIINALAEKFGDEIIKLCWFQLRQSVNRHIQEEGLQRDYRNENDPSIREAAHMMCSLAFVPVNRVCRAFDLLKRVVPRKFSPIIQYFEVKFYKHIQFF